MAVKSKQELKDLLIDGHLLTGDDCTDVIDSLKAVQDPVSNPLSSGESVDGIFVSGVTQDPEGVITPVRRQNTVVKQQANETSVFDLPVLFQNEKQITEGSKIDLVAFSKLLYFNPSQGVFTAPIFKGDGSRLTNLPSQCKSYQVPNGAMLPISGVIIWNITHNLSSSLLVVSVTRFNSTTWTTAMGLDAGEQIKCKITQTSADTLRIELNSETAIEAGSLRVSIIAV